MNYPHLYIKSLLEECKQQNLLMTNHHQEFTRMRLSNYCPRNNFTY